MSIWTSLHSWVPCETQLSLLFGYLMTLITTFLTKIYNWNDVGRDDSQTKTNAKDDDKREADLQHKITETCDGDETRIRGKELGIRKCLKNQVENMDSRKEITCTLRKKRMSNPFPLDWKWLWIHFRHFRSQGRRWSRNYCSFGLCLFIFLKNLLNVKSIWLMMITLFQEMSLMSCKMW